MQRRNIQINAGDLSIGSENLFDDIETAQQVTLYIDSANELQVQQAGNGSVKLCALLDADLLDQLAIDWCRKRKLQGALAGPVGQEWGSPDCDYQ